MWGIESGSLEVAGIRASFNTGERVIAVTSVSFVRRLGMCVLGAGALAAVFFVTPLLFLGVQPLAPTGPAPSAIALPADQPRTGDQAATPPNEADAAFLRAAGRPSVDAVWNQRMRLASPAEWVRAGKVAAPVSPLILAYAPADDRRREPAPFAAIDAATGSAATPQTAATSAAGATPPVPHRPVTSAPVTTAPATTGEDDEDEDEEDVAPVIIPRPLPRPRLAVANPQASAPAAAPLAARPAPALNGVTADPAGIRQALALPPLSPAPPAAPRPQEALPEGSYKENQNYVLIDPQTSNVRLASLVPEPPPTRATPPLQAAPTTPIQPAIILKTPFGIPYALQQESVETSCFPPPLVDLIRRIEQRYGQKPVITSGLRDRGRRGSLHRRCQAADLMIPGVSAGELAKAARLIPGMGGVGQYCHPNLVHIDIGTARDWKQGCGGYFALRDSASTAR